MGVKHFQHWFPQYGSILDAWLHNSCQSDYDDYVNNADCGWGGCQTGRVVHCLLHTATESSKANMAAAAVLLGLLPTILGIAGSTTSEMGLLAMQRPSLAFLLAAGAPAVSPIRAFDFDASDPAARFYSNRPKSIASPELKSTFTATFVVVLQYLLAIAAVVNVVQLSWLVGTRTVCSFASDTVFLPLVWSFATLAIHALGTATVVLRVKFHDKGRSKNTPSSSPRWHRLKGICKREFQLNCQRAHFDVEIRQETYRFIFLSWCTSIGVILHIVAGTVVFSSILFISTQDALGVLGRYLASTIICRAISMFEINSLKARVHATNANTPVAPAITGGP